jgi:phosphohistidine phosphatase
MMRPVQLVLLRHAIAEDAGRSTGGADARRRLTREGRRRMRLGARGRGSRGGPVDVVASSPLARAVETAQIAAKALGVAAVEEVPSLAPGGRVEDLLAWLQGRGAEVAVLVGHEPGLSRLAGRLVTGRATSLFTFKKGGACSLALRAARPGTAQLEWLATARILRDLGAADGQEDRR